jgi:hypothetical protein
MCIISLSSIAIILCSLDGLQTAGFAQEPNVRTSPLGTSTTWCLTGTATFIAVWGRYHHWAMDLMRGNSFGVVHLARDRGGGGGGRKQYKAKPYYTPGGFFVAMEWFVGSGQW